MVFQIPKLPIFGRSAVVQPGVAESSAPFVTSAFGISAHGDKKSGFVTTPTAVSGVNPWLLPPALSPTLGGMLAHDAFFSDVSLKAQLNRFLKQSAPKDSLTLTLGYREGKRDGWGSALWNHVLPDLKHLIVVTPQTRRTLRTADDGTVLGSDVTTKPKFKKTRGLQLTQYTALTMPKSQFGPLNSLLGDTAAGQPQWIIKRSGQSWERLDTQRNPEKLGYHSSTPPIKQWFHEMLSGWLNTLLGWPMEHGRLQLPNGRVWPAPVQQWQTAQGEPVKIKQVLKTPKGHWVEVLHAEVQPWLPMHKRHNLRAMVDTIVRPWERAGAQLEQAPSHPMTSSKSSPLPVKIALPATTILGKPYGSHSAERPNPFLRATMEARHKHNRLQHGPLMSGRVSEANDKKPASQPLPLAQTDLEASLKGEPESTDPATTA